MAIDWAALAMPVAQGLGAYTQGKLRGEQQKRAEDAATRKALFDEWATRRTIDQRDELQNERLRHQGELADVNNRAKALIAQIQAASAQGVAQTNAGAKKYGVDAQYGPGGASDRTNASAEQRIRISVDGANRRDNLPVQMPDGTWGMVDAQGRVVALPGKPMVPGAQPGANSARVVQQTREAAAQVPGLQSAYQRVRDLVKDDGSGFSVSPLDEALVLGSKTPALGSLPNGIRRDSERTYEQAMREFESAYVLAKGGKTVTPFEKDLAAGKFRIRAGDPAFIRAQKLQALERAKQEIEALGAAASPAGVSGGAPVDDPAAWLAQHRAARQGGQ